MYQAKSNSPAPIFNGTLEEMAQAMQEYQAALAKIGLEPVSKFFTEFFDNNPTIYGMAWTQYTPFFNDGDACIFHVHDIYYISDEPATGNTSWKSHHTTADYLEMTEDEFRAEFWDFPTSTHWIQFDLNPNGSVNHQGPKTWDPIYDNLIAFEDVIYNAETILQNTFGDHSMIIATRGGFQVDEYNHD